MPGCGIRSSVGVPLGWLSENWFSLVQSAGIVGGLVFTAASARQDTRSRRNGNLLTFTSQHRELWSEVHRRPELSRILQRDVDLIAQPMTVAEEEFLNTVFVHVQTGWDLAKNDDFLSPEVLETDMRNFLTHPLPRLAWESRRKSRDPRFMAFMDACAPLRST